jgi:hypothetical protein
MISLKAVLKPVSDPTKRAPEARDSAVFSSILLTLGFSYISSRNHAHPHAGIPQRACGTYAIRWVDYSAMIPQQRRGN